MKKYFQFILEKSSLTQLGVPKPVMQQIQKDYAISKDASWLEYTRKMDVKEQLLKPENSLFIQVIIDQIVKVFGSIYKDNHKSYFLEEWNLDEDKEWGGEWKKGERHILSITSLMYYTSVRHMKAYKLEGDFETLPQQMRKEIEVQRDFQEFTEYFKKYVLDNFSRIIRGIFGNRAENEVKDKIIQNISKVKKDLTLQQIRKILVGGVEKIDKTKIDIPEDPLSLKDTTIKDNSLTIFDEYLLGFEEAYSEKEKEFVFVEDLCKKYTLNKVIRAFIYYIYNGKVINL